MCSDLDLGAITTMRTLVDLLNDDTGYVRIYAELSGFGYERSTYDSRAIDDLFDRMSGYTTPEIAREAALLQLLAAPRAKRSRKLAKPARR